MAVALGRRECESLLVQALKERREGKLKTETALTKTAENPVNLPKEPIALSPLPAESKLEQKPAPLKEQPALSNIEKELVIKSDSKVMLEKIRAATETYATRREFELVTLPQLRKKAKKIGQEMASIFISNFTTEIRHALWQVNEDFKMMDELQADLSHECDSYLIGTKMGKFKLTAEPESSDPLDSVEWSPILLFPTILQPIHRYNDLQGQRYSIVPQPDGTLEDFWGDIANEKITEQEVLFVVYQCLLTLEYFRMRSIIHGHFDLQHITINYKDKTSPYYLRVYVTPLDSSVMNAKKKVYSKESDGNPFNLLDAPPEVIIRNYRPPTSDFPETFWEVFKGFDCWSLGKSIIESHCFGATNEQRNEFKANLQKASIRTDSEFKNWLGTVLNYKMPLPLATVCRILLQPDNSERDIDQCLLALGVNIWIMPELIKKNLLGVPLKRNLALTVLTDFADNFLQNQLPNDDISWQCACKLQWFSKQIIEEILENVQQCIEKL